MAEKYAVELNLPGNEKTVGGGEGQQYLSVQQAGFIPRSVRIEITHLNCPIGVENTLINIPVNSKERNMCIFKTLSYAVFCRSFGLKFPKWLNRNKNSLTK